MICSLLVLKGPRDAEPLQSFIKRLCLQVMPFDHLNGVAHFQCDLRDVLGQRGAVASKGVAERVVFPLERGILLFHLGNDLFDFTLRDFIYADWSLCVAPR